MSRTRSVDALDTTWSLALASIALMVEVVNRPPFGPHTMVFDAGRAAPLAQTVKLPLAAAAFTSNTVSATAVAPLGTPVLFTVQSRVIATLGESLPLGPWDGVVPGRESYIRAGAGNTWNEP